ncbi:MAG: class I SAM-dependent methyltransferase [Bacteroidota bacterium]
MKKLTDPGKIKATKTYNAAADHYDDAPLAFWDLYGRRTVQRLDLAPGSSVLDVACGTGASALPSAELVGPKGKVVAVDLAERLLELGRAKAASRGLENIEFQVGDMTDLGFPDEHFDAVVCVFGIFFVADMESHVGELWRMVRPGGRLAITTWGPRIFAPVYEVWLEAVKAERPDLYSAFNPWDRITDVESVRQLFLDGGVENAEVVAEDGRQALERPEDWWTVALGSGLRWTIDQMGPKAAARVRDANLKWIRDNGVNAIETNVIYAVATKDRRSKE